MTHTNKKVLCKTEYWMLRCKCKKCADTRDFWLKIYMNKIWSDATIKSYHEGELSK